MDNTIQVLERTYVFQGRVFRVRQDRVRLPNRREAVLDIVEHRGAVVILPVDDRNRVWFVRQYRHAVGGFLRELPAGTLEPDEPPETCARRELREEIGMQARSWTFLGTFYPAPGYTTERMLAYLARDLEPAPLPRDEDELIEVEPVPWAQLWQDLRAGRLQDAKTLATLLLALPYLSPPEGLP